MSGSQTQSLQSHHDVVCVGFNISAISLAIKLRELSPQANVLFLEPVSAESWKPNGDLPEHMHMHTNFLNDLVTLQNPRSEFTFVNFLHQRRLLVDFTNLGAMEPSRRLFEDYLRWCARIFQSNVRYGREVLSIEPVHSAGKKISGWNVFTTDRSSDERRIATAAKVVICLDKAPAIPACLSGEEVREKVVEASGNMALLRELVTSNKTKSSIAIVGQSQEAAELFEFLYDPRADRKVVWFARPNSGTSEIRRYVKTLQPIPIIAYISSSVSSTISDGRYPPELKSPVTIQNIPSLSPSLVGKLDEILYAQSVKQPNKQDWKFRIESEESVQDATLTPGSYIQLSGVHQSSNNPWSHEFDLVVSANGYTRQSPKSMLDSVISTRLLDGPVLTADANYHINLRRGVTEQDVGLWCIGLVGQPDIAVGEASLTITAERSTRVAKDLVSRTSSKRSMSPSRDFKQVQAQL